MCGFSTSRPFPWETAAAPTPAPKKRVKKQDAPRPKNAAAKKAAPKKTAKKTAAKRTTKKPAARKAKR